MDKEQFRRRWAPLIYADALEAEIDQARRTLPQAEWFKVWGTPNPIGQQGHWWRENN